MEIIEQETAKATQRIQATVWKPDVKAKHSSANCPAAQNFGSCYCTGRCMYPNHPLNIDWSTVTSGDPPGSVGSGQTYQPKKVPMICPNHPERMEIPCHKCLEQFFNTLEGKFVHKAGELVEQGKDIEQERIICAYYSNHPATPPKEWKTLFMRFPNTNTQGGTKSNENQ